MIKEYMGMDLNKSGFFVAVVLGNTVLVTLIFWLIYGFDVWKQDVRTASQLMAAAAVAPAAQAPAATNTAGQFVCPRGGAVGLPHYDAAGTPHCPVCGQVMNFCGVSPNNLTLVAGFACPPGGGLGGGQSSFNQAAAVG